MASVSYQFQCLILPGNTATAPAGSGLVVSLSLDWSLDSGFFFATWGSVGVSTVLSLVSPRLAGVLGLPNDWTTNTGNIPIKQN